MHGHVAFVLQHYGSILSPIRLDFTHQASLTRQAFLKASYLYCFHYVVSYSISVSLLLPITISVIENSQIIGAEICALSYENNMNIGWTCQCFAMGWFLITLLKWLVKWSGHFVHGSASKLNLLSNFSCISSSESWYLRKLDTFSNSQKQ